MKKNKELFLKALGCNNIMVLLSKVQSQQGQKKSLLCMLKSFLFFFFLNQYHIHTNVCLHKILTVVTLAVLHKDLKAILIF